MHACDLAVPITSCHNISRLDKREKHWSSVEINTEPFTELSCIQRVFELSEAPGLVRACQGNLKEVVFPTGYPRKPNKADGCIVQIKKKHVFINGLRALPRGSMKEGNAWWCQGYCSLVWFSRHWKPRSSLSYSLLVGKIYTRVVLPFCGH